MNNIANIQLLRAIAALLVVLHHAYPQYQAMGGNSGWIQSISTWGFVGVDIFFVISGFLMGYTMLHKKRSLINVKIFLQHRFYRIYFGYWPFFFAMFLSLILLNSDKIDSLDLLGSFFLLNLDMSTLVLAVSWSLNYELYFYFIIILLFFIPRDKVMTYIPIVLLLASIFILYSIYSTNIEMSFFYSHFFLEFFIGIFIYLYKKYLLYTWLIPLYLILLVISIVYGIELDAKNGIIRIYTFGTMASSLFILFILLEEKNIYISNKYFIKLGDASFTLYLSHSIIFYLYYHIGIRDLFVSENILLPLLGLLVILISSIMFSIFYYQRIEKPLYRRSIGRYKK